MSLLATNQRYHSNEAAPSSGQVPGVLLGQLKPLLLGGPAQSFVDSDAFLWQFASRQCWSHWFLDQTGYLHSWMMKSSNIFSIFHACSFQAMVPEPGSVTGFWFRSLRAQRKCRLLSLTLEEMVDTYGIAGMAWHVAGLFSIPKMGSPLPGHQGTWPRVFQRSALPQSGRERGGYLCIYIYIYICVCV